MSYGSRTQYPSASRTGRGRGRSQPYQPHLMSRPDPVQDGSSEGGYGGSSDQGGTPEQRRSVGERSLQSHGAHYVLSPDPSKNSKLKQTARQEEAEHVRYKEEKRERTAQSLAHQPPKAVGGVEHTLQQIAALRAEQEKRQQKEARFEKVRSRQKREEYRRQEREREDAELERKKQLHRKGAAVYEAKKQERQRMERDELRKKRLAHFNQPS